MFTDTHCHLNFKTFQSDLPEVIERAWEAGLTRILIPGTNLETSQQAIRLAEKNPGIYASVGIHPNDISIWDKETQHGLRDLCRHPKVLAVGEIGLDYYRDRTPRPIQMEVFREQLEIAAEFQKPVILHSRQAFHDLWPMLAAWQEDLERSGSQLANRAGVLHSFEGNRDDAAEAFRHHFFLGISGPVTYLNAVNRQETVAAIGPEKMLLETDAPFLTPHPFRGHRNEPAYVTTIAKKVADLCNREINTIASMTSDNAEYLFAWRNSS